MGRETVWVGMSGGVDSSVAALLLREHGYDVMGITLKLTDENAGEEDARRVCGVLGLEHHVVDMRETFRRDVIDYFINAYMEGRTPNPCVACNRLIKFGALMDYAVKHGADCLATGHYARVRYNEGDGRYCLHDTGSKKDQSYFLYSLSQEQLARAMFPLDGLEKSEVRAIAAKHGLPVASKSDSMDICFVPCESQRGSHAEFIEHMLGRPLAEGDFINSSGNVLGRHKGIARYTVGQRKGLGIATGQPMYVTSIDSVRNAVVLGGEGSQVQASVRAGHINYVAWAGPPAEPVRVTAKIRYAARPAGGFLSADSDGTIRVDFDEGVRAVSPGQSLVFYEEDMIAGGGIIL